MEQKNTLQTTTAKSQKDSWTGLSVAQIITQSMEILAACHNRQLTEATVAVYLQALTDVPVVRVAEAFQVAVRESKFFPSPAHLRELAGMPTISQVSEAEADKVLRWLLWRIEKHGVDGHALRGKLIVGERRDGKEIVDAVYEKIPAPELSERVVAALEYLGYGSQARGMALLAEHPLWALGVADYPTVGLRLTAAEKIEARWLEAWKKTA
jgi:hypothetical protein